MPDLTLRAEIRSTTVSDTSPTPQEEYLDEHGIARVTNTTARMGRRIIAERRVPVIKIGRYVRVRRSDLEAWMLANTQPAVSTRR